MSPQPRRRSSNRFEIFIGRSLAACAHPVAAWRSTVRAFRVALLAGYFAVGYVCVLIAMVLMK